MPPDRRPSFSFVQGKLCITTAAHTILLNTWPEVKAVWRKVGGREWKGLVPIFRLLRPKEDWLPTEVGPREFQSAAVDPLFEKQRAFRLFRQALPPQVATACERFRARQFTVLRMIQAREAAAELLEQNPALGFCAAHLDKFQALYAETGKCVAALTTHPQRTILQRLGFPDAQAWVNLFRKILPETITLEQALALRKRIQDEEFVQRLAHVPVINSGVLEVILEPAILAEVTSSLLNEIALADEERVRGSAVHLLLQIREISRQLEQAPRLGSIKSIETLRRRNAEAAEAQRKYLAAQAAGPAFPPPPLPGTEAIIPLKNKAELLAEGNAQHHCVGGYGPRVAGGALFVYRVLKPERATLSIRKGADGCWQISELRKACNEPVSAETTRAVERWLQGEVISI